MSTMTATPAIEMETETTETRVDALGLARKALQASLGVTMMAQEEVVSLFERTQKQVSELVEKGQTNATDLMDKMVTRGADVEKNGRERLQTIFDNRKKQVDKSVATVQDSLDGRIEAVLHNMNVPTKSDIEALNKKIADLTRKINALAKQTPTAE